MEANKNRFYTNLVLGVGLSLFVGFATYQFSNVMFEGRNYVASVNGQYITPTEFKERMNTVKMQYQSQMGTDFKSEAGQKTYDGLRKQIMQELVLTKIMLGNAAQEKIEVSDETVRSEIEKIKTQNFQNKESEFKKALKKSNIQESDLNRLIHERLTIQQYVEKLFADNIKITDADLRKAYEAKKMDYSVPEGVQASHILVKTLDEANKIEAELKAGKSFSDLAQQYSIDTGSKVKGGDLGYFGKGMMVPEFEKAAFALKIGEISQPVKSQFGYHIIKKTGYRPEKIMPFEEAKERLDKSLKNEKQKDFFAKWRETALKDADVKYNTGYENYSFAEAKKDETAAPKEGDATSSARSSEGSAPKEGEAPASAGTEASAAPAEGNK